MTGGFTRPRPYWPLIVGAALLAPIYVSPVALGQYSPYMQPASTYCPPPPCPGLEAPPVPTPGAEAIPPTAALPPERFAAVGGTSLALATPNMVGDASLLIFRIPPPPPPPPTPVLPTPAPPSRPNNSLAIEVVRGTAFKTAEDESPRPVDRVYIAYNFFSGVAESSGFPNLNINLETIGLEKTFLNGDASIGLRLPFFEFDGSLTPGDGGVGDMSVILKYAFINDRDTGNVLSAGLIVTAPTGEPDALIFNGAKIHDTLLQPWAGAIVNMGDWYVQGFSSLIAPTDSRDVTLLFSDMGVGYWLYRSQASQLISAVAPTLEVHVTTPLTHRESLTNPLVVPDIVDLTGGFNILLNQRSYLTIAAAMPMTGPQPFDFEAIVQLNFLF